ncbi:hypothetical protein EBT25_15580 [bacterium]|jgi:hypothetical protein|nr:hypothetical protein [bacterium]
MVDTIKLVGTEIALSTANTVGSAAVVRLYNNTAGAVLVTYANTGGTLGTCTLAAGAVEYFTKQPADTLAANSAIRAAAIAYT